MPKKTAQKPKPKQLLLLLVIALISSIALFMVILTASRVGSSDSTSPNAPVSEPQASEGCLNAKGISKCKKTEVCINDQCKQKPNQVTQSPTPYISKKPTSRITPTPSTKINCGRDEFVCNGYCCDKNTQACNGGRCVTKCVSPNSCNPGCTPMNREDGFCPGGQSCCGPER